MALKLAKDSEYFGDLAKAFGNCDYTEDQFIQAREKSMLCVYKAKPDYNLESLKHKRFQELVATSEKNYSP